MFERWTNCSTIAIQSNSSNELHSRCDFSLACIDEISRVIAPEHILYEDAGSASGWTLIFIMKVFVNQKYDLKYLMIDKIDS